MLSVAYALQGVAYHPLVARANSTAGKLAQSTGNSSGMKTRPRFNNTDLHLSATDCSLYATIHPVKVLARNPQRPSE